MSETSIPPAPPPVSAAEPGAAEAQEPIVGRCEFRGSAPAAPPVFSVEPKALESQEPAVWHFDLRGSAAAAEPKSALDAPEPVVWRFAFRGDAYEFFNIWLANTLLTIATVGLFSPWAKVRTLRYFYGSAFLNGANFDYHASPWSILAARLVVLLAPAAAAALFFSERPLEDAAFTGVIFLLLPWAIVRGFAFNARYTSHRGARFAFKKRTALAYLLLFPVVVLVALLGFFVSLAMKDRRVFVDQLSDSGELIILALVLCAIILALGLRIMRGWHRFKAGNHSLGQMQFHFEKPHVGAYFFALWGIPLLGLALLLVVMLFLHLFSSIAEASGFTIGVIAVFLRLSGGAAGRGARSRLAVACVLASCQFFHRRRVRQVARKLFRRQIRGADSACQLSRRFSFARTFVSVDANPPRALSRRKSFAGGDPRRPEKNPRPARRKRKRAGRRV